MSDRYKYLSPNEIDAELRTTFALAQRYNVLAAQNAPEINDWAELNIKQVQTVKDFTPIPHKKPYAYLPNDLRGITCPIPDTLNITPSLIKKIRRAIESVTPSDLCKEGFVEHPIDLYERETKNQALFKLPHSGASQLKLALPQELNMIVDLVQTAFKKAITTPPKAGTHDDLLLRLDSNQHKSPATHRPAAIVNIGDGDTTIIYKTDEDGIITGKKASLTTQLQYSQQCMPRLTHILKEQMLYI